MSEIKILATGPEFLKPGIRSFEPVIEEMITSAEKEIQIVSFVLTRSALGLLDLLESALERGVKVTLILDAGESKGGDIRSRLASLEGNHEKARVLKFSDPGGARLHAKIFVTDRNRAIIGSANLSWGGMVGNYEIGLLMEGDLAWKVSQLVDGLGQMIESAGLSLEDPTEP